MANTQNLPYIAENTHIQRWWPLELWVVLSCNDAVMPGHVTQ